MKVYAACLSHETSSFSPIPTARRSFEQGLLWWPRRDAAHPAAQQSFAYALTAAAEKAGHEVVAGLHAVAEPSGPMVQVAWEKLRDELLEDLAAAGKVDAILLMLHGAQMASDTVDCEGDLLARIRRQAGAEVVIGVELDLHASLSPQMVDCADFILPCREYPHIDFYSRAADLVSLVERRAAGQVKPVTAVERVPMLGMFHTTREPMRSFVDRTIALEKQPGVLAVSLIHGFPWADTPFTGAAAIVTTDGDPPRARELARSLADEFFGLRDRISAPLMTADEALDIAGQQSGKPVVIADAADNPGGGAAGDATHLVRRAIERNMDRVLAGMIWDPQAVQTAMRAGVGTRLAMRIGGKTGPASGEPLDLDVEVIAVRESSEQILFGARTPLGPTAALRASGMTLVVGTTRTQVASPECFSALGLDVATMRVVIVKSAQHFHAAFAPLASRILYVDTPGAACSDFGKLPYRRLHRPIWPLDAIASRNA